MYAFILKNKICLFNFTYSNRVKVTFQHNKRKNYLNFGNNAQNLIGFILVFAHISHL